MPKGIYLHKPKHGHTPSNKPASPTYRCWINMHSRCRYPSKRCFAAYGGRGITVCERWNNFELFLLDMGERPSLKHSIERLNNDLGYSPDNCKWATRSEQARNMKQTVRITINGETLCATDWAIRYQLTPSTVLSRINLLKWDPVKAVTTPLQLNQYAEGRRRK